MALQPACVPFGREVAPRRVHPGPGPCPGLRERGDRDDARGAGGTWPPPTRRSWAPRPRRGACGRWSRRRRRGRRRGPTGVRLWIGPGGGSSGCPRGPVTLRGCSCGTGRGFALADPLRSVRSACGVRCWCPRSARDWPGRSWPRCPGHAGVPARRVPGRAAGREVRRLAGRSAAAILASRAGAAGAGGWRRARCRCFCGF